MPLQIITEAVEGPLDDHGNPTSVQIEREQPDLRSVDPAIQAPEAKLAGSPTIAEIEVIEELPAHWRIRVPVNVVLGIPKLSADPVADLRTALA